MIIVAKRKGVIFLLFLALLTASIIFSSKENTKVFSGAVSQKIIIDAGHGLPDGGAVGMNGTIESTLNIKIAQMVKSSLVKRGYTVIMTRTGENSISENDNSISQRKKADMHKRLDIVNSSGADMFVSIHMNKFTDSRYKGAQVIYSKNFLQAESLAACIQQQLCTLNQNPSSRSCAAAPDSLFLLKNANIPSVLVECGFLSNYEEEKLLNTEKYQKELSRAIVKGIENYYRNLKELS